ncbi:MAG TPA: ammonia channel protein, partial [Actinomycetes bacterium]|nr:ammonia channel protein [Actinomycetes bacterium]
GGFTQLGKQAVAAGAVLAYSFIVTFIIGKVIDLVIGFRVSEEDEETGVDVTTHAETGYDFGPVGAGGFSPTRSATSTTTYDSESVDRSVNA